MTTSAKIPAEYRPLSPWAYFGYSLLYSVPLVGWIFLIVFALDGSNINRRNFSRSYFVIVAIWLILLFIALLTGFLAELTEFLFSGE